MGPLIYIELAIQRKERIEINPNLIRAYKSKTHVQLCNPSLPSNTSMHQMRPQNYWSCRPGKYEFLDCQNAETSWYASNWFFVLEEDNQLRILFVNIFGIAPSCFDVVRNSLRFFPSLHWDPFEGMKYVMHS